MTTLSTSDRPAEGSPRRRAFWVAAYFLFLVVTAELVMFCLHVTAATNSREFIRYFGELPMPAIANFVGRYGSALLLLTLPWIVFAIVNWMRGTVTTRRLLGFSTTLLITVAFACIVSGIAFGQTWMKPTGLDEPRVLQPTELADAVRDAERDNPAANYLLFRHHVLLGDDPALAERYLKRAANLGSELARQTLRRRNESAPNAAQ